MDVAKPHLHLETRTERIAFHRKLKQQINSYTFMVAETSFPSISVGYEISIALNQQKPILILHSEGDPPSLLAFHESNAIVCEKYSSTRLDGIISDFLDFVRGYTDSRFTFFISSKQAAHLNKVSREKRIPKSAYLRDLIDCDIERSN